MPETLPNLQDAEPKQKAGWIPYQVLARILRFCPDPEENLNYVRMICSDKTTPTRCPIIFDRRDVIKGSAVVYSVYYEPHTHAGLRYPRILDRKEWMRRKGLIP